MMTQVEKLVQNLPDFSAVEHHLLKENLERLLDTNRQLITKLADSANPDWESLAQPMEDLSDKLNRFWSPISHLNSVMNSDDLRQAYTACIPLLSQYSTEIGQNARLQSAYKALSQSQAFVQFDQARKKAVSNTLRDFHLAGVDLPEDKKRRYKEISQRLAELASKFSDNVLDATQAWTLHLSHATRLAGFPETALDAAQQAAKARNLDGYLLTLEFPSYYAVMTYADDRLLRRELYEAYCTRASDMGPFAKRFDNSALITEILALRQEKAAILGFGSYADYSLATKMAKSVDQVMTFLRELARKSRPVAEKDFAELCEFAATQGLSDLMAWDVTYFSEKLRQHKYAISQEELKPYFPADRVIQGLFTVVEKLFGVTMEEDTTVTRYHPDVKFYRLFRQGESIAAIYMDLYARENKRGGAWMADYAVRRRLENGTLQMPVAFITCNFSKPSGDRPALLTHDEVTTLFHEFGHALHHMLTQVDCYDVSGINGVAWDAVELPSQFLENWCWQEEAIPSISSHFQTGEPLPSVMLERLLAAKNFQAGMTMMRQLEFALFDFRLHTEYRNEGIEFVQALLDEVRQEVAVLKPPVFNRFQHSFSHIFAGGYAAGYYSYKWAEVLSADAFSLFEEKGIFDPATGRRFYETVLAKGGSQDPLELFVAFRGREPQVEALLRHNGMAGD
jgi:oligopeptidase A